MVLPDDQLRLVSALVLSVPLSFVLSKIQNPTVFKITTILLSLVAEVYVFRGEVVFLWLQQHIAYAICRLVQRRVVGKVMLLQTFAYLLLIHARRMYIAFGSNEVEITATLMMQAFLYIGFAYNYQDGREKREGNETTVYAIKEMPSYIDFMAYLFFLPASLVGPVFQYADFENYVSRRAQYKHLPSTLTPIRDEFFKFIIYLLFYIVCLPFSIEYMVTEQFASKSLLWKIVYSLVAVAGFRCRYYTAWSLGLIGMNASGITYNPVYEGGVVKEERWDKIKVSDMWTFQMDPSMKSKADNWNMSVQLALKRYIYNRSLDNTITDLKMKKTDQRKAQEKTIFASALWHGLYLGYFFSFFHWALLLQISQEVYRIAKGNPTWAQNKKKYYIVELVLVNFMLNFFGITFVLMTWEKINALFHAFYYFPLIAVYIGNILFVRLKLFSKKSAKSQINDKTDD